MKTSSSLFTTSLLTLLLAACGTTQISMHSVGANPPLCESVAREESALVLWGPAWRTDQKDIPMREQMAENAIRKFFANNTCYPNPTILRSLAGKNAATLSDAEVLKHAASLPNRFKKIILLRLEELGPVVTLNISPIPLVGATEVVFRTKVLNAGSAALDADVSTHWKSTQPYLLKGVKTLEQDFQDALSAVFLHKVETVDRVF